MATGQLTIDLNALASNWRALDALSAPEVETAAVVKANGYGLGSGLVAERLADAGARSFFVATVEEALPVWSAVGHLRPTIYVFSGHMAADTRAYYDTPFVPLLNSAEQVARHLEGLPGKPYGLQLDTGMNRLGMEPAEFGALRDKVTDATLVMSHLACADTPDHAQNEAQLQAFLEMTEGLGARRSLAATGGTLMGAAYHFDLCRPGVGLYGGLPFAGAAPVVTLSLPVVQVRDVAPGESVGYAASWVAEHPTRVATVSAGYADGLIRAASNSDLMLWAGDVACPLLGRVSMDLLTVDVSALNTVPDHLDILSAHQTVDQVADQMGTIGYEVLTSLGGRYVRNTL